MNSTLKATIALSVCVCLSACGGGGGGGTGNSASLPPVPNNPPSLPEPVYSGIQTPATISQNTAVPLAVGAIISVQSILTSTPSPYFPSQSAQVINEVVPGPQGGSALVQGRIASTGSGWVVETMSNYQYQVQQGDSTQIFAENGIIDLIYQQAMSGSGAGVTLGFNHLTVIGAGNTQTINGTIQASTSSDSSCENYTANVSFSTPNQVSSLELNPVTITGLCGMQVTNPTYTVSGRVYESGLGYADFSSVNPVVFDDPSIEGASSGGPLKLTGGNDATIYMDFINRLIASVGVDETGDGLINTAVRFSWKTGRVDTTPGTDAAPLADVTQQTAAYAYSGVPVTLDGRDSHSPAGKFLTFQWSIVMAPIGSAVTTASLANADTATPSFTPDVTGDYLLRLTVSDGVNSGSTDYVVSAETSLPATTEPASWIGPNAGTSMVASIGQTVQLDGSASSMGAPTDAYSWSLQTPAGSKAKLSFKSIDPNMNQQPTFVPDVPGYYIASYGSGGGNNVAGPPGVSTVVITVGEKYSFAPAVELGTFNSPPTSLAVADFNKDGKADVVLQAPPTQMGNPNINVYFGSSTGLSPPQSVTNNAKSILVADLTGLGAPEILTQLSGCSYNTGTFLIFAYQAGHFQNITNTNYAGCGYSFAAEADAVPSSTALVTTDGTRFITFEPPTGNTYASPINSPFSWPNVTIYTVALGKLTGSAYPDIVATGMLQTTINSITSYTPVLAIFDGTGEGTYAATPSFTEPFGDGTQIVLGNLSTDGLTDIVAASSDFINTNILDVFYRTATGGLNTTPESLTTAPLVSSPVITDLNGDGRNDLVVLNTEVPMPGWSGAYMSEVGFYLQQPNGTLGSELLYPTDAIGIVGSSFRRPLITVGDINGDGVPDIVIAGAEGDLYVMLGKAVP